MDNLSNLAPGAKVERRITYTIEKVNKKSVILMDDRGNKINVRERNYGDYNILRKTSRNSTKKTTSNTTGGARVGAGRMPKWANTNPKKAFVREARTNGQPTTEVAWKEYRKFQKTKK